MTADEIATLARQAAVGVAQVALADELRKDRAELDRKQADLRTEILETLRHNERETNNGFVHHGNLRREALDKLLDTVERRFVTLDRYAPVERLLYATVSVVLLTVLGWMLSFLYQQGGVGR